MKEIEFLKRQAKFMRKNTGMNLMKCQHEIAKKLGFRNWGDLILQSPIKIQMRIDNAKEFLIK